MAEDEELLEMPVSEIQEDTTCTVCNAEFLDPEDLQVHTNQVHKSKGKKCYFCTKLCNSLDEYASHIIDIHLLNLHSCRVCKKVFSQLDSARKHERKHRTVKNKYACSQCDAIFINLYELQEHEMKKHDNDLDGVYLNELMPILSSQLNIKATSFIESFGKEVAYICNTCMFSSPNPREYLKHLKKKNCTSKVCNRCSNVYRDRKSIQRHLKVHKECHIFANENDLKKKCLKCQKNVNIFTYEQHMKGCTWVQCNMCGIYCGSMYELSNHQMKDHPMAITMKICQFCRREFVGTVALQKHIDRTHKGQFHLYKYACHYCENTYFKHPKELFGHYFSRHQDLQPYSCKICNLTFRPRKKFTLHIKLKHKSVGFVEFDEKYHVFFTDKKSENPFKPKSFFADQLENNVEVDYNETDTEQALKTDVASEAPTDAHTDAPTDAQTDAEEVPKKAGLPKKLPKIRFKEQEKSKEAARIRNKLSISASEDLTESEVKTKKGRKRKATTKKNPKRLKAEVLTETNNETESSDDEPLSKIRNLRKRPLKVINNKNIKSKSKDDKKQFTCRICKKYCYTYQNYNNHLSLHSKNEIKKCIKCSEQFYSQTALKKHIQESHSSSQLTETLKSLLERRKSGKAPPELSATEKFRKTIKKVKYQPQKVSATIKETAEKISVQKFIESFTPEEINEKKKILDIQTVVSVKPTSCKVDRPPAIKLTKYKPKPFPTTVKLAMPVHYKDFNTDKPKVNVKMVQQTVYNEDEFNDYHEEDIVNFEDDGMDRNDTVPDVAQEVMLDETQEVKPTRPVIPHTIVIPKMSTEIPNQDIRIAHLAPEAPYYKIVTIKNVKGGKTSPKLEDDEDIKLPSGTKLVNVNPLAHLIGDTPVEKIVGTSKYKKTENFERAIAKALLKLETPVVRKKPTKKKKEEKDIAPEVAVEH